MTSLLRALLALALTTPALHAGTVKPPRPSDPFSTPSHERATKSTPVVRVNSTNQGYDMLRPWLKSQPFPRRGTGAILEDGSVLVSAQLLADHTFVELEMPGGGAKCPAEVIAIDYEVNLGLLKPSDPGFLRGLARLSLAPKADVGDPAEVLQIEENGDVARTPATVTSVSVMGYPLGTAAYLGYTLGVALQQRDNSFTLPVVRGGKLLGLLMRYNSRTQTAEVVPSPVISHFLALAEKGDYPGLPKAGLGFAPTRDPQFRQYLGLHNGGVYITQVIPGSPAARAGLQVGDILFAIDNYPIDPDGLYDDRDFGKILFSHLISSRKKDQKMALKVIRDGRPLELDLPYGTEPDRVVVSRPHLHDTPPPFLILGGLVFQELSRPYLASWGRNWEQNAPQRLVYLDAYQNELPEETGRVVILSDVLPSPETIGYESLHNLVVNRVNGVPIRGIQDLASAVEKPIDGFHQIEFEEDPGIIYLDAQAVESIEPTLQQEYDLPYLQRFPVDDQGNTEASTGEESGPGGPPPDQETP